jgi:hypothetical protein
MKSKIKEQNKTLDFLRAISTSSDLSVISASVNTYIGTPVLFLS